MAWRVVTTFLLAALCVGCGSSGPTLYDVRGKVSWDDGKPVSNVAVTFVPSEKGVPTSAGRTNSSGEFVLTTTSGRLGAGAGKFKVILAAVKAGGAEAETPDKMAAAYKSPSKGGPALASKAASIPAEYTSADSSPVEIDVTGSVSDLAITIVRGSAS